MALPFRLLLVLFALWWPSSSVGSEVSNETINAESKFARRSATKEDLTEADPLEVLQARQCPKDIRLQWIAEIESSIYASPVIRDLHNDGQKEVVVAGARYYLHGLDGASGQSLNGWPAYHAGFCITSPVLHDIDGEGEDVIMVPTYEGKVLFYGKDGNALDRELRLPRLRVKRDWHEGLQEEPTPRDHPDVGSGMSSDDVEEAQEELSAAGLHARSRSFFFFSLRFWGKSKKERRR